MNYFSRLGPVSRRVYRQRIVFLMIHGVVDFSFQTSWRPLRKQLSVQNLSRGLAALNKYYNIVSMNQAVSMLAGLAPLQPRSLVLTFDDGYRNNITHALPILQRYKVPATFFLCTGHVKRRVPFWYDRMDYAIQHLRREQLISFAGKMFLFRPNQEGISRQTFTNLRNIIKADKQPYDATMRKVDLIADILEENARCRLRDVFEKDHYTAIMSWEEARLAVEQGVTIGSHTVDHSLLDLLDEFSVKEQLAVSKNTIEKQLNRQCSYFCYPNGNWNNASTSLVGEAGFAAAITTDNGLNKVGDNLLTLRRVGFPEVYR